jgi:hypothetical protein
MNDQSDDGLLEAKLTGETAKIRWSELQRFFAQGRAVQVQAGTDLIEVAAAISRDQTARVEALMGEGRLGPVSDDQARAWIADDALVWALVVRPWVLVQSVADR